jgi:hypothetical protein
MSKDLQFEKRKAINLSDRAIARRVLIVEHLSNIYARVNSVKSGLLAQEDIKSIDDMFGTVKFCVDMVHDMIVGSKIIELEPAAENAEGEQLENNSVRKAIAPCPTIVCLCGSTRFSEAFRNANLSETLAGKIVLSIGCDFKSDQGLGLTDADKEKLDILHLRKIDLADEVLILNVNGYIGKSTRKELDYALTNNKRVRYLEALQLP